MRRVVVAAAVALGTAVACGGGPGEEAREAVMRYNRVIVDAYRTADIARVDTVVAPGSEDGRRLTGLIGAKLDMGVRLDAELIQLEVTGSLREGDRLRVWTSERWRYRERRIGSDKVVGEESEDEYEMLYLFTRVEGAWMVDEVRFTAPPRVGRSRIPDAIPITSHVAGASGSEPRPEGGQP